MPKTDKSDERAQYMIALFKKSPDLSIHKANEQLAAKYHGVKMRLQKAYKLRDDAREQLGLPMKTERATKVDRGAVRARPPGKARIHVATTEGSQRVALVQGNEDQLSYLASALEALKVAGIADLTLDHQGSGYAIIRA